VGFAAKQNFKHRARGRGKVLLGLAVSVICLIWIGLSVEREDILAQVASIHRGYLFLAIVATFLSYALRAGRWPFFFDKNPPDFAASYRCLIVGFFMNNVLPARIGEFVRAHLGGAATNQSRSMVLATIAGERLMDGLTISALFAVFFSLEGMSHPEESREYGLLFVAGGFFAATIATLILLALRERVFLLLERMGRIMPGHISSYTLIRIRRFVDGLEPMFRLSRLFPIGAGSLAVWGVELLVCYFVSQAYHYPLSLGQLTLFLAAVNFSSLIPAAPAGAGVIELVATEALEEVGVPRATALAMVTTQHLVQILTVGLPGLYFFYRSMGGKLQLDGTEAAEDELQSLGSRIPPAARREAAIAAQGEESGDLLDVSVIIPAYNEERRLPKTLLSVFDYLEQTNQSYEILVVDDGSRDETGRVAKQFEELAPTVRMLTYPRNRGKGYAVRFGMYNARGRLLLFDDADGATPISEIERLTEAIARGADVAIGSRALDSQETEVQTVWYRKFLGRVFNGYVNMIVLPGIADTQCGFKLFTRNAAHYLFRRQRSERFSFDVELLFLARRAGLSIAEVPVNWTNVAGSKVNLVKDSIAMGWDMAKIRMRAFFGVYNPPQHLAPGGLPSDSQSELPDGSSPEAEGKPTS